nr:MAG TPA: hypothetical protein [Crassvirales sp.]
MRSKYSVSTHVCIKTRVVSYWYCSISINYFEFISFVG